MAKIMIASARHDENGKLAGAKGDQLQTGQGNDLIGEVSMQEFYVHKYGWDVLRFINEEYRVKMAKRMVTACNNPNIGYSQPDRLSITKDGIESTKKTNADCGTLVRQAFKETTGIDPGNFTTSDEKKKLEATGLVSSFSYTKKEDLRVGDILVSKKKGHTACVVVEAEGATVQYYPKYTGKGTSIVSALATVGEKDTSMAHRKLIAKANGIDGYQGSVKQNLALVDLIKAGKLIKA